MSIDGDFKKLVVETKQKMELEARLYELLDYVNRWRVEYTEDLKEVVDSLGCNKSKCRKSYDSLSINAHDFSEFDIALRLASRAVEIEPSIETQINYREIYKIRKFCGWQ